MSRTGMTWPVFVILLLVIGCAPAVSTMASPTPTLDQHPPATGVVTPSATPLAETATTTPEETIEAALPSSTPTAKATGVVPLRIDRTETARLTARPALLNQPVAIAFADASHGWLIAGNCNSFGAAECGIFATSDGGTTWTEQYRSNRALGAVTTLDVRTSWVSGRECSGQGSNLSCQGFLLGTADGGRSWDLRHDNGPVLHDLQFLDASNGWSMGDAEPPGEPGLRRTTDGGRTWVNVPIPLHRLQSLSFVDATHGWIGGACLSPPGPSPSGPCNQAVLFATSDGGAHWSQLFSPPPAMGEAGALVYRLNQQLGWVITGDNGQCTMGGCWGQLYRTTDGGKTWTLLQDTSHWSPGTFDGIVGGPGFPGAPRFASATVGWIPIGAGAGPGQGGVARTADGGVSWQRVGGQLGWSIDEVVPVSKDDVWAIGGPHVGGGRFLLHSVDSGRSWSQVMPLARPEGAITFVDARYGFGIGSRADPGAVFATTDGGRTWQQRGVVASGRSPSVLAIDFLDQQTGWVALLSSEAFPAVTVILGTNDGGAHWQMLSRTPNRIIGLRFFSARDGMLAAEYVGPGQPFDEIQTTQDGGSTWRPITPLSLQRNSLSGGAAILSPRTIWLGEVANLRTIEILTSHDGGIGWNLLGEWSGTLGDERVPMSAVSDRFVWLAFEHQLLRTDDAGASWTNYSLDPAIAVQGLSFVDANVGWLGTQDGRLYRTTDGGASWEEQ
jgi:photosystem II stability/assembly factor-like uncharacterized protein